MSEPCDVISVSGSNELLCFRLMLHKLIQVWYAYGIECECRIIRTRTQAGQSLPDCENNFVRPQIIFLKAVDRRTTSISFSTSSSTLVNEMCCVLITCLLHAVTVIMHHQEMEKMRQLVLDVQYINIFFDSTPFLISSAIHMNPFRASVTNPITRSPGQQKNAYRLLDVTIDRRATIRR